MTEPAPQQLSRMLLTIGYEGMDIEEYLEKLNKHDIKVLVDVRKDPVSRKPGFSKKKMTEYLERSGIRYEHFPMLGIEKRRRCLVNTPDDREELFNWYREEVLGQEQDILEELLQLLALHRRVALTCYEQDPLECHRSIVAVKLMEMSPAGVECLHL